MAKSYTKRNVLEIVMASSEKSDANALRRLTRKGDPSVIIRAMSRVRQFSANITGDDFDATKDYLEKCFAFKDNDGYILRF